MKEKIDDSQKYIDVELYLDEDSQRKISDVQKEYLEEELREVITSVKEGQINIAGIYAFDQGDEVEVKAYLANGLSKNINFEDVPIYIINSKNEKLAYQIFDLSGEGDIPSGKAIPVKLNFKKENVFVDKIPQDDWKLVFGSNDVKGVRYVNIELESIPEGIEESEIKVFQEFLESLPKLERGQGSISVFTITQYENGDLLMTLIVRNATDEAVTMTKMPITLKTEEGETILSGVFDIENFTVNPYKARVLSLIFKKEVINIEEDFDLSTCKIIFGRE
ncbi:SLAP domain-containing protein [Clostridium cochlearium]|uniref:SLAP domain-containing protein n=1 Tax=Clostridium cochlearium TaxID=1494 RepID=UPI00156E87CA|nr:SLAP domain-containing protein [Clostridium cochlearium]MBV1820824.1 SLAP domain-containing protein [Bacteroidales bacterium MSK.15.36]MCG4571369.1 SLAP domain-containing protein [Clostridium cochlearium]MCG4580886.1 SLAP domain-containing protein [Clostridium cochlearium]NSJ90610.1 SLAP domain-containing protein [Coprococcus sp. MSK.21.13]